MIATSGEALAQAMKSPPAIRYRTGITALDNITNGGPAAGHMIVLGAVSGHGKSSIGRQIALYTSIDTPTLYVTLEETRDEVLKSLGAKIACCSVAAFERSQLDLITKQELDARHLFVMKPKRDIDIVAFEKIMRTTKCPIVILDHLREFDGWIADARGNAAGHTGPGLICRRLKKIAEETGKLLIVLHQAHPPKVGQKRPGMFDLMDTKMLPQSAWLVVLAWRPYFGMSATRDTVTELLVVKNRYGTPGTLHYRWVGQTGMLWELSPEEYENLECCGQNKRKAKASA